MPDWGTGLGIGWVGLLRSCDVDLFYCHYSLNDRAYPKYFF